MQGQPSADATAAARRWGVAVLTPSASSVQPQPTPTQRTLCTASRSRVFSKGISVTLISVSCAGKQQGPGKEQHA